MDGKHLVKREMLDHHLLRQQPSELFVLVDGVFEVTEHVGPDTMLLDEFGYGLCQETRNALVGLPGKLPKIFPDRFIDFRTDLDCAHLLASLSS